jgi:hypothetical protein
MLFFPIIVIGVLAWGALVFYVSKLDNSIDRNKKIQITILLFALLGLFLPYVIAYINMKLLNNEDITFLKIISEYKILLLFNVIPLSIYVVFSFFLLKKNSQQGAGIIGAGSLLITMIFLFNLFYCLDFYSQDGPSSTGVLIFLVIPILGFFIIPIGFWCGFAIKEISSRLIKY